MQKRILRIAALVFFAQVLVAGTSLHAQAQGDKNPYPSMAPLQEYLIASEEAEVALARTGAPKSISDAAEVMVLRRDGYATAVKGTNGFVCLVERSFAAASDAPEFWNPKNRSPICYNPAGARTYLPIVVMRTKFVLAGKSKAEIGQAIRSAVDSKQLPELEPGAMSYMLSKQQYLTDEGKSWLPHVMFFVPGDTAKRFGANLDGSPVLAAFNSEERVTVLMVPVGNWSDGSPAPQD
jgi:hypothetical protein